MDKVAQQQEQAVTNLLPAEQMQQLKAAGVSAGILAGLFKAFVQALLANLPGLLGVGAAKTPPTPPKEEA